MKFFLPNCLIISFLIFINSTIVYSQTPQTGMASDTSQFPIEQNSILFGVNKNVNVYYFNMNADLEIPTGFGKFRILENYTGSKRGIISSFRDDQNFTLDYSYPLNDFLSITSTQNWILVADQQTTTFRNPNRVNGSAGFRYDFLETGFIKLQGGFERNKLPRVVYLGSYYDLEGELKNIDVEGYDIDIDAAGELINMNPHEKSPSLAGKNHDFVINANAYNAFDFNSSIDLDFFYKTQNRDLMRRLNIQEQEQLSIESRLENRVGFDLNTNFLLWIFPVNLNFNVLNAMTDKSYNEYFNSIAETGILRKKNEFDMYFSGQTGLNLSKFKQTIGLSFLMDTENNTIQNVRDIPENDETILRDRQNRLDENIGTTAFFGNTLWRVSNTDSLQADFYLSMYREDTPSEQNNNDKDRLNLSTRLAYAKRLSSLLSFNIGLETRQTHLVYLKAERSGQNYWTRFLGLNPRIYFKTDNLLMNPSMHVYARYMIYDYESASPTVRSLSTREVEYSDSIRISLNHKYSIQSRLLFRYYENGSLFWDSFSELPETGNFEQFTKIMFLLEKPVYTAGLGIRYYRFVQERLNTSPGSPAGSATDHLSYGPETYLSINLKNTTLYFSGWYEFQHINDNIQGIPNFSMSTAIKL